MFGFSRRFEGIEYAIRELVPIAKRVEQSGKKVHWLNIGDPLKFDFDVDEEVKRELCKAVNDGKNFYSDSAGVKELREVIAKKEKSKGVDVSSEDVIVTQGISEAIMAVFASTLENGDEVLLPGPGYPLYNSAAKFFGAKPVAYKCDESNGWMPDIDDIKAKITDKTKMIVVINPNNPTGAVYDRKTLKSLVDLALEHDLAIVSDEIYDELVFTERPSPLASLTKEGTFIVMNGFSKTYLMTGWRLGYVYVKSDNEAIKNKMKERLLKYATFRLCANTPVQYAAIKALSLPKEKISKLVEKLKKRRDLVVKRLKEIDGLDVVEPKGTFYAFPRIYAKGDWKDDKDFTVKLLEETGVFVVYGSGFDETYGKDHFRLVFLPTEEEIEEAMEKLESFMKKHAKAQA